MNEWTTAELSLSWKAQYCPGFPPIGGAHFLVQISSEPIVCEKRLLRHYVTPRKASGARLIVCAQNALRSLSFFCLFSSVKMWKAEESNFLRNKTFRTRKKEIFTKKKNEQFRRRIISCHDSTERERNQDRITAEAQKRIKFILLQSLFILASEFQTPIFLFQRGQNFRKERTFEKSMSTEQAPEHQIVLFGKDFRIIFSIIVAP